MEPSAYLVLWPVGVAGDLSTGRLATDARTRQVLVDLLLADYPAEHAVIAYEAATLPIGLPRMDRLPLGALPMACLLYTSRCV